MCDKGNRDACVFACKCYDEKIDERMGWDGLDEKERAMDVKKEYVEVNDVLERDEISRRGVEGKIKE